MGNTQAAARTRRSKNSSATAAPHNSRSPVLPTMVEANCPSATTTAASPPTAATTSSIVLPIPERMSEEDEIRLKECLIRVKDGVRVELSGQGWREAPHWIGLLAEIPDVSEILIQRNHLCNFPTELAVFRNLERLGLGSNELRRIPDEIAQFRNLVWLDFTHNRISHVSDRLGELPRLASLGASDCRLHSFPLAFTRLRRLRKLGVFNNLITSLPPEIGNLTSLTKLDLSGNALGTLPPEIGRLTSLTWLNISNNRLTHLPPELGNLTAIRELGLAHNALKSLPDLGRLRELTLLTAFNNELVEVGDWIVTLPKLAKIDLSTNRITSLPAGILGLPSLELLNLRHNFLLTLPPPSAQHTLQRPLNLAVVDLRENLLASLPITLLGPSMRDLKCLANPFCRERVAGNAAVPSLVHLILKSISRHCRPTQVHRLATQLTPTLRRQTHRLLDDQIGQSCLQCHCRFLHLPVRCLDVRETTDDPMAPFLVELCSPRCREHYMRNSTASLLSNLSCRSPLDSRRNS